MEIFWNTIAAYNAATWPAQIGFTLVAAMLLVLLYLRPTPAVRIAMKLFMAFLNFWIAGVYYMIYCRPREYHGMLALFWAIMGGIWIYELLVKHASLERTGQHNAFAILLLVMPLIYPLCSLALGHEFPIMTSPVMPCSVAVFTIGLMLAFSERVNIVLAMFLCHWHSSVCRKSTSSASPKTTCWRAAPYLHSTSSFGSMSEATPTGR